MNRRKVKKFTADFETSTPEWYKIDGFARVWAFAICEIGNTNNFIYGNSIDDFMKICSKKGNYLGNIRRRRTSRLHIYYFRF